ncbi:MAG: hypothetical protein IKC93_01690 [Candidatus Methanomethylophilaceae archaeon]|nr:hypothetical protein [Candidatus Methanomethylophilaceae archaeon]
MGIPGQKPYRAIDSNIVIVAVRILAVARTEAVNILLEEGINRLFQKPSRISPSFLYSDIGIILSYPSIL